MNVFINYHSRANSCAELSCFEQERLRRTGLGALTAAQGLAALGGVLNGAAAATRATYTLAVTPVDWPTFLRRFGGRVLAVFEEFAAPADKQRMDAFDSSPALRELGKSAKGSAAASEVAAIVRDSVRSIAGRAVPDNEPLMAAGAPVVGCHVGNRKFPLLNMKYCTSRQETKGCQLFFNAYHALHEIATADTARLML